MFWDVAIVFFVIKRVKRYCRREEGKRRNETRVLLMLDGESRETELRKKKKARGAVKFPPSRDPGQVRPRKLALCPFLSLITRRRKKKKFFSREARAPLPRPLPPVFRARGT